MRELGLTRSVSERDHLLQTPDTFVRAPLPGMHNATAVIHIAPAAGAKFTQYTAEFEAGGALTPAGIPPDIQRFVYILEGEVLCPGHGALRAGEYAYFPPGNVKELSAPTAARAVIIEKPYVALTGYQPPSFFVGNLKAVEPAPLLGDPDVEVCPLLPADPSFDLAVNMMSYQPGAALPMVETHVMEHGLLMLAGGGIYRLNERWYPVSAGDFIWMAPFCPQWFGALGKTPAKYLIYKDWNRSPLEV